MCESDHSYFKFRRINDRLFESLANSQLFFASPNQLNDPFDCQPDLRSSFSRARQSATGTKRDFLESALEYGGQQFFENAERALQQIFVCSFSSNPLIPLMWSHYADEHRGVCISYRFPASFLKGYGVYEVQYGDNVLTHWLQTKAPMELGKFNYEFPRICVSTKSLAWQYECEVRIIGNKPGLVNIGTCVDKIYFGLRTPQDNIDQITKIAADHCGCENFLRVVRDQNSDFGITVKEP